MLPPPPEADPPPRGGVGGGRGTWGQPAGSPTREGGGGWGKGSHWQTAVPRPWASDRCKPGRQGSLTPASPSGVGGSRGPAQEAEHQHHDAIAQPWPFRCGLHQIGCRDAARG